VAYEIDAGGGFSAPSTGFALVVNTSAATVNVAPNATVTIL